VRQYVRLPAVSQPASQSVCLSTFHWRAAMMPTRCRACLAADTLLSGPWLCSRKGGAGAGGEHADRG
jgi:hypothetical protein